MENWASPLTAEQFREAARLISAIKDHELKTKTVLELNYYAGGSVEDEANRKTYEQLSNETKVIVDNATCQRQANSVDYVLVCDVVPNNALWYYAGYFTKLASNYETLPKNTNDYTQAMKIPYRDEAQEICDEINNLTQQGVKSPFIYHVEEHMYFLNQNK